ncbi:MAG: translation initiation factor IF-3 [Candidatus Paceibacterota bacterium]
MPRPRKKQFKRPPPRIRTNEQIRVRELRVIGAEGENIGTISSDEALAKAKEAGLDLIEISPNAKPPVAKIMDFGKYLYDQKKKLKQQKASTQTVEVKNIQVKPATGEHDLEMKAKQASKWLKEGNRVKVELFLRGRSKYMDQKFLRSRLDRFFNLITEEFKIAQEPKKSPKGLTAILEKA